MAQSKAQQVPYADWPFRERTQENVCQGIEPGGDCGVDSHRFDRRRWVDENVFEAAAPVGQQRNRFVIRTAKREHWSVLSPLPGAAQPNATDREPRLDCNRLHRRLRLAM